MSILNKVAAALFAAFALVASPAFADGIQSGPVSLKASQSTAASVGSCTGLGTGGTCALASGSTDSVGNIVLTTGTSPSNSGSLTLTFSAAIGPNGASCIFSPTTHGGSWNTPVGLVRTSLVTTSVSLFWANNGVNLTGSSSVNLDYVCFGF